MSRAKNLLYLRLNITNMNEKSNKNLFKVLLAIGAAIIVTGAVVRIFYGFLGHVVIALGIIVGAVALYSYINNLNNTIDNLRNKLDKQEQDKK